MLRSRVQPDVTLLVAAALALLCVTGVAGAQERTWTATDGVWSTASNWDPPDVPDSGSESALIPDDASPHTISFDMDFGVDCIRVLNPNATLNLGGRLIHLYGADGFVNHGTLRSNGSTQIWGRVENAAAARTAITSGYTLYLHGPTLVNDGEVLVNEQGTGDAALDVLGVVDLSGSGAIVLNGDNENDGITSYYGNPLTQQAGHTIRGFGSIIAPVVNYGTIDADRPGGFLRLSGYAKTNHGLMRASNGSLLHTLSVTIENAGGTILADGGDVLFQDGYVNGGTVDRTGFSVARSWNTRFNDVTIAPTGWVDVPGGCALYLTGPTLVNDGTLRVNETGTADATVDARTEVSIAGTGEIVLNGNDANDGIVAYYGNTVTQGADHTIRGFGAITAPLVNHGTVDADRHGGFLRLSGYTKTNPGLMRATNGGLLHTLSVTIENAGGTILADGGDVLFQDGAVNGGTIDRTGSSVARSWNTRFGDVTIAPTGWVDVPSGYTLYLTGPTLVNDGTLRVNETATGDAFLDVRADLSIAGTGEIVMNGDDANDVLYAYYGNLLTQGADHTIRGFGAITAPLANHGTVDADRNGGALWVSGSGKSNDGLYRASNGGALVIRNGCALQNAGGTVFADGGDVVLDNQGGVVGGTLHRSGASVIRSRNGWITSATIAGDGWVDVSANYGLYLSGSQVVNHGTIRLNDAGTGDSWIDVRSDLSLAGTGEIVMNGDDANDVLYAYYGNLLTQEADHTIRGFGAITAPLANHGTVDADRNGGALWVSGSGKSNDGLYRASNGGALVIRNGCILQNAGGTVFADGGDVVLDNQGSVVGGTLRRSGASVIRSRHGWISSATIAEDGWVDVPANYGLYLSGSQVVNHGTIRLNDAGTGDSWIDVRGDLSLAGTGEIVMNGDNIADMIYSYYGNQLTQEAEHTIHGKGRILCPLLNRGVVRADSASLPLLVEHTAFNNRGVCEASNGAQLQIHRIPQNYAARALNGGTWIARENSSIVLNAAPVDTTNAAILLDGPGSRILSDYGTSDALAGLAKIGRGGSLAIRSGRNFTTAGALRVEGHLVAGAGCTFTVNGPFTQIGNDEDPNRTGLTQVDGTLIAAAGAVDIQGGTLCGNGIVQGNVTCAGGVAPGAAVGILTIQGNYTQTADGTCWIELGGSNAGQYDQLQITGQATLTGRLVVTPAGGYVPPVGQRFTILHCGSRAGQFTLETGSPGVGLEYTTTYYADRVEIEITGAPSSVEDAQLADDQDPATDDAVRGPVALFAPSVQTGQIGLRLDLPEAAEVELSLFDFAGRRVALLRRGAEGAGRHAYAWQGGGGAVPAASGVYLARARVRTAGGTIERTTRVLLVH